MAIKGMELVFAQSLWCSQALSLDVGQPHRTFEWGTLHEGLWDIPTFAYLVLASTESTMLNAFYAEEYGLEG